MAFPSPRQQWKLTHPVDPNAPDLGDSDGDGVSRRLPNTASPHCRRRQTQRRIPPRASRIPRANRLRLFLQRDPEHNDVTVVVEAAGSLAGPWSPLATSTLGAPFTGPGYVSGDAATPGVKTVEIRDTVNLADAAGRFVRVRVTTAP